MLKSVFQIDIVTIQHFYLSIKLKVNRYTGTYIKIPLNGELGNQKRNTERKKKGERKKTNKNDRCEV